MQSEPLEEQYRGRNIDTGLLHANFEIFIGPRRVLKQSASRETLNGER
jgi:hypothetical protein